MPNSPQRLIVQHPSKLTDEAHFCIQQQIGRPADLREAAFAIWRHMDPRLPLVTALRERANAHDSPFIELTQERQLDSALLPESFGIRDLRLIALDMDSTLISIECIDEIAAYIGKKDQVEAITQKAMQGELDFAESLAQRLALLANTPQSVLQKVYTEKLSLSPGAETLIQTARTNGVKTMLVSGGFSFFSDRLRKQLLLDEAYANELEIVGDQLSGKIKGRCITPLEKKALVERYCMQMGCTAQMAMVIGDGANDLPMLSIAGISVAYHAKSIVRSSATHSVSYCGLDFISNWFRQ